METTVIRKKRRESRSDRIFYAVNLAILFLLAAIVVYPLYFIVIASISNADAVLGGRVFLYPVDITLVGYSKSGELTLPISLALDKELTFKTVFRYRHIYPMAIEAVAEGKVNLKGIVTDIYDLDDAQQAMDDSINKKADIVKAVIKINKDAE